MDSRSFSRRASALVLAAAAAAPSSASEPLVRSFAWPPEIGGSGAFGRTVVGHFLDPTRSAAVTLRRTTPVALVEPHLLTAFVVVTPTRAVTDIAVISEGALDALLAASPDGLFRYVWDDAGGAFVEEALGSAVWAGCSRVLAADLDASGGLDVVGIAASGTEVLRLARGESGQWAESVVPIDSQALDLVVQDFLPGGAPELVAHTTDGLRVYDDQGALLYEIRTLHPDGALAVVRSGGETPEESIAWLAPNVSNDALVLRYVNHLGIDNPTKLELPPADGVDAVPIEAFAAVAGDWDGDGLDDLVLPHETYQKGVLLLNQGEPKHFKKVTAGTHYRLFDLAPEPLQPAPNASVFGFADLDGTGRATLVAPLDHSQRVLVVGSPTALESSTKTIAGFDQSGGAVGGFFAASSYYEYDPSGTTGTLSVVFEDVDESLRQGYGFLQVIEWSQPDPTVTAQPLRQAAVRNDLYVIDTAAAASPRLYVDLDFDHAASGYSELYWEDRRHAYLQMRFVNVDDPSSPTPDITEYSHSFLVGLTVDDGPEFGEAYLDYLRSLPGNVGEVSLVEGLFQPDDDNNGVGAVVVLDFLPPFAPGSAPRAQRPKADPADRVKVW